MLVESYFYPGFFSDYAKEQASRGPLGFIIKNYILRCKGVPRLIAYKWDASGNAAAYFATEAGIYLGYIDYAAGHGNEPKYTMCTVNTPQGAIHGNNSKHFAESLKSSYIITSITKSRASSRNPVENAESVPSKWFGDMVAQVLYKHGREMRKRPDLPPAITTTDMKYIAPVLLDGASPISIPAQVRGKVEAISKYINQRTDENREWGSHINEMFGREKWAVIPRKFVDDSRVYTVGAFSFPDEARDNWIKKPDDYHEAARHIQITQPFTTYRTIEDLPDDLQAVMTMQQHMLKTSHSSYVAGTDNMVPYTGAVAQVIWPEMNSGVYDTAADTVVYILDK